MSRSLSPAIRVLPGIAAMCLVGVALASNNKSLHIDDGAETGGRSTVNGSITVGSNAVVDGSISTVNGSVTVNSDSRIEDAETVNGSIRLGRGVTADLVKSVNGTIHLEESVIVKGEVSVVNGKISIWKGSQVSGGVSNVNGKIDISDSEIGGDLRTVSGDVTLAGSSILRGDLLVEKPGGWFGSGKSSRKPRIVIGPGAQVVGSIRLEREVELFISDSATVSAVSGEMSMDDAILFSGPHP